MKIAILNDIHGNLYLLKKALTYLESKDIDLYLINGDFLTDGPDADAIITTIKSIKAIVTLGNREESILLLTKDLSPLSIKTFPLYYTMSSISIPNIEYLKTLPKYQIINVSGKKILMSHGLPKSTTTKITENSYSIFDYLINEYNADIYFFAHTHRNFNVIYKNRLFINSGAINCSMGTPKTSTFGILTIKDNLTFYNQESLPYDFNKVVDYYKTSEYYQNCKEWSNLILATLETGIGYLSKFSTFYDKSQTMFVNYQKFIQRYQIKVPISNHEPQ